MVVKSEIATTLFVLKIIYFVLIIQGKNYHSSLVSSIKNANISIKYEGIELQKWLIAWKKGINVVVGFQYPEIG